MQEDAIEGLTRLGLSTYEAKVFVGLHKLGTGSAGEVAEVTDVPRSQVYGATEGLEEIGLIDVQEGTPTVYRPIPVSEARYLLFDRMKEAGDTAFDYVESVSGEYADDSNDGESVWRTDHRENIAQRVATMIQDATDRVTYCAAGPDRLESEVLDALGAAVERGVVVRVGSSDPSVREAAAEVGIETAVACSSATPDLSNGRVVTVDDDGVLLSVLPGAVPHIAHETAFWSSDTAFARILVSLVGEWFGEHLCTE